MKVWLDGHLVDESKAVVPIMSHSFGRGTAVFEVADIVPTDSGTAIFRLDEHIDRFFRSAAALRFQPGIGKEELRKAVLETARINGVEEGTAKFFAYLPGIELGIRPKGMKTSIAVFCMSLKELGVTSEQLCRPVTAGFVSIRKPAPESLPPWIKVSGGYISGYLARMEAAEKGFGDVILLDERGYIAEAATANTFFVREGRVITPTLRNILPGITRESALLVLKDLGIETAETDIQPADILACGEAFYTTSFLKIQPMMSIEGRLLPDGAPGPITRRLSEAMALIYSGKNPAYRHWLARPE